jgi:hypothetical protein
MVVGYLLGINKQRGGGVKAVQRLCPGIRSAAL